MRSKWSGKAAIFVVLALVLVLVQVAGAGGSVRLNSVNFSLGSLELRAVLVGLGNEVSEVKLVAKGAVNALCQNKGGTLAPGRNPILVTITAESQWVTTDSNGRAEVLAIARDPEFSNLKPSPTPKQAGCPNGKWTVVGFEESSKTNWTLAQVIVKNRDGVTQIDKNYTLKTDLNAGVITWEEN
jgi:hypothetical protein